MNLDREIDRMKRIESHLTSSNILSDIPKIKLNDGKSMPLIGYGTYKVGFVPSSATGSVGVDSGSADDAEDIVKEALHVGYRFLDCAQFYGNERAIGRAIRDSGIKRSDIYLTSKVWNDTIYRGPNAVRAQVLRSLSDLGTDYLDLYLIHWPVPNKHVDAYKMLVELQREGKIRSVGVSNYTIEDFKELQAAGVEVVPAVNQIEVNPWLYRRNTVAFFQKHGVLIQAYRALRQGKEFENPLIQRLSRRLKRSPSQILGRWCIQNRIAYLAKTTKRARMLENAQIFDFALTQEDMIALGGLTTPENLAAFRELYFKCVVRDTPLSRKKAEARRITAE